MVVFTCGHCGESVQKPKVEKHYLTKCRNKNPNLSCMDCFKDFLGQDYEAHTKCITEEERYSGKGFTAKEKKGEKKQNTWVEMLQSVLEEQTGAPKNVLRIVETISKHTNTPRKKPKFINFVKNVCGHKTNQSDIDQAWDLISVKLGALSAATQNGKTNKNVTLTNGEIANENDNSVEKTVKTPETQNGDSKDPTVTDDLPNDEKENVEVSNEKKLTKKQRKQEKKRQKYEAELQSAAAPHENVVEEEEAEIKKGKKKKNRTESTNGDVEEESAESKKQKKRKRQDTVNSVNGVQEIESIATVNSTDHRENEVAKDKTKKKKQRVDSVGKLDENLHDQNVTIVQNGNDHNENEVAKDKIKKKMQKIDKVEILEESLCLHDQNVAIIEEAVEHDNGKFNWHAVIMSVLEKKGNELPFKRLQKKVLSEYTEATGREVDDRIADKFIKKLKSAPNVRVDKNRVMLVE